MDAAERKKSALCENQHAPDMLNGRLCEMNEIFRDPNRRNGFV